MYCPECGSKAEPGDRFCGECGSRLEDVAPPVALDDMPSAASAGTSLLDQFAASPAISPAQSELVADGGPAPFPSPPSPAHEPREPAAAGPAAGPTHEDGLDVAPAAPVASWFPDDRSPPAEVARASASEPITPIHPPAAPGDAITPAGMPTSRPRSLSLVYHPLLRDDESNTELLRTLVRPAATP